jgi:chitin disaccharide deacetylase
MDGPQRFLIVTADDFGIGPATSEGILDAADSGAVSASVLLVNSPHAESAVRAWRQRGCPMALGWHPNLTLDSPVLPATQVPSLTGPDGKFWPLKGFLTRWLTGRLRDEEIEIELTAQLRRFCDLTGQAPAIVNTHQHVGVFAPVGLILLYVLERQGCFPFVRRVRESWPTLFQVPGARIKRGILNWLGRSLAHAQEARQYSGNDWLAGITDPKWVKRPTFFKKWLNAVPGNVVELMCHPGHLDNTLLGRDCQPGDGLLERRVDELRLLQQPDFLESVREAGFTLAAPDQLIQGRISDARAA